MKFKVGQIVKVIDNYGMVTDIGATGIVIALTNYYGIDLIDVKWKTNFNNQMNGGYQPHHFSFFFTKGQQLLFPFMEQEDEI